jgi:type I restriction enzyme S subunit
VTVIAGDALELADADWMRGLSVPRNWKRQRVKHLVRSMRAGDAITVDAIEPTGTYPVYGANGLRGFTSHKTHHGIHVLIGRQGALCGNVHLVSGDFWASEHAIVATPTSKVDARWLAALLHVMNLGQYSTSAAQPGIGVGQVAPLVVYVPPLDEQRAIADFLDRETAQIDALVAKQEDLVRHLVERRLAIVTEAALTSLTRESPGAHDVGRWGASLAVEPWLARAPKSWAMARFKTVCRLRDERNVVGNETMLSLTVRGELVDRSTMAAQQNPSDASIPRYLVARPKDLVVNPMWLTGGAIGVSDKRGAVSPDYRVFEVSDQLEPWYLHAVLRSAPYFDQYRLYTRSNTTFDRRIKQNDLDNLPIPIPPRKEQRAIVEHINEQTSRIDALTAKAQEHIGLAKERRAALITAAVTGRFDARTAQKAV